MSLPTNFFIGRLGLSRNSDFIWAMQKTTTNDFKLFQLDSDTLAVKKTITSHPNYNTYWNSGTNPMCCDDEGNVYFPVGIYGTGSTDRIVSFAPNGSFRWESRLDTTIGTATWAGQYAQVRYKKSEDKLYVWARTSNTAPATNCHIWRLNTDGTNVQQMSNNGASGAVTDADSRCFVVADNSDVIGVGGTNTSGNDTVYFIKYSGNTVNPLNGFSVSGGALGMSYSPLAQRFYYSSQYNNDTVYGALINNISAPTSINNQALANPGSYMYGGSVSADSHPLFSGTGGAAFFSYYDGFYSYMIRNTSALQFVMDSVFSNAGVNITINAGTLSCTYNPNNGRFYASSSVQQSYSVASNDVVSFTHNGNSTQVSDHTGFGGQIRTATNWQGASNKQILICHTSSTATQNGL